MTLTSEEKIKKLKEALYEISMCVDELTQSYDYLEDFSELKEIQEIVSKATNLE